MVLGDLVGKFARRDGSYSVYIFSTSWRNFLAKKISGEVTYGLERLAMYLQDVDNVYDIIWDDNKDSIVTYGDVHKRSEYEFSVYNFEVAGYKNAFSHFDSYFNECKNALSKGIALPAYDYCMLAAHTFNVLDARGVISVTQRQEYILKNS